MVLADRVVCVALLPRWVEGTRIARLVEYPDGSGQIETWDPQTKSWRRGGTTHAELLAGRTLTPAELKAFSN